jgi:hypothetical protein
MPPPKISFSRPPLRQNALLRFEMLPSLLTIELPIRPQGIDLGSRYLSSHPPVQGPLTNGAASARDGGERAGWMGSSTASDG